MNLAPYVTVAEACQISGLSGGYVRRLIREKKIEGTKIGNTYLVLRSSAARFKRQPGMGRPPKDAGKTPAAPRRPARGRRPRK